MEKAFEKLEQDAEDAKSIIDNELTWTRAQEQLLVEWADKAACYRWLYDTSERYYQHLQYWLTIPVIVMSTLAGTANFGVSSMLPPQWVNVGNYCIGAMGLGAGLITAVSKFLCVGETIEGHRQASIAWGKLHRLVSTELALRRDQRVNCQDFVRIARAELDRLIEMSPMVPQSVISAFKRKFSHVNDLHKPEICNGIDHTRVCEDAVSTPARGNGLLASALPSLGSIVAAKAHGRKLEKQGAASIDGTPSSLLSESSAASLRSPNFTKAQSAIDKDNMYLAV
jgi:hypothetical protein